LELSFPPDLDSVPADCEVLSVFLGMPVDAGFLDRHPGLLAVMTRSHSVDHIDTEACRKRGVQVRPLPPYGTRSVAEHTFALLLTLSRRIRETVGSARGPAFSYAATRGFELAGKTLGLVGLGRVGSRVARIALGFGMRVLAFDPGAIPPPGVRMAPLETVLGRARILSLHAKLTPENRHLLNRETLGLCRRGVILLNTARGGLVDLQALREALQSGQVGGAGLDVLEEERLLHDTAAHVLSDEILDRLRTGPARSPERLQRLRELVWSDCVLSRQNVIFTPHVGFNSAESARRVRHLTARCLRRWVLGAGESRMRGTREARPPPGVFGGGIRAPTLNSSP
jgi:D-lactate dehydrogenase